MSKYIVIEMQNGNAEQRTWDYPTQEQAEVKYCEVRAAACVSAIATHTIMMMTDEGFVLECKCYKREPEQA